MKNKITRNAFNTKKNSGMRELNASELKMVSGALGFYLGWTKSDGFNGGIYLGKKPGPG